MRSCIITNFPDTNRLTNISETDGDGNLINLDSERVEADENGNIYYELPIRVEIFAYKPQDDDSFDKITDRQMSEEIKKHYLNRSLVESIDNVLQQKIEKMTDYNTCSTAARQYYLHEIKDELLSQRGNLDQVLFSEIFAEITKQELLNIDKIN